MKLLEQLLSVLAAYQAGHRINETQASKRVFNSSRKLGQLRDETELGDVTTATFERAMQFASDNWPPCTRWPAGIARPERQVAK